jgi:hypothetical protein
MAAIAEAPVRGPRRRVAPVRFVERYFYTLMALLVAVVVTYGFSRTVDENLFHAAVPRPVMLWIHGLVFYGWLVFFLLQSVLVRMRSIRLHRTLGWFGAALGIAVVVFGVVTTFTMARFQVHELHKTVEHLSFLSEGIWDMLCFASCFGLAIWWRKRPEFHRRLVLIANCAMSAPGFGRFPALLMPRGTGVFYGGVDLLILMGMARDRLVDGRVHRVYKVALPIVIAGQALAIYLAFGRPAFWERIALAVTR